MPFCCGSQTLDSGEASPEGKLIHVVPGPGGPRTRAVQPPQSDESSTMGSQSLLMESNERAEDEYDPTPPRAAPRRTQDSPATASKVDVRTTPRRASVLSTNLEGQKHSTSPRQAPGNRQGSDGGDSSGSSKQAGGSATSFNTVNALKNIPLLNSISKDELKLLADNLTKQTFGAGDVIMREGELGRCFYLLAQGTAKVFTRDVDLVATLEGGDYCGEQALLNDTVRGATVEVTSDKCICLVCDQATFKSVLGDKRFAKRDAKRRAVLTAVPDGPSVQDAEEDEEMKMLKTKDPELADWLLRAVNGNLLFDRLDVEQRKVVIKEMYREEIQKGKNIITQGMKGDTFHVVESGRFNIIVNDKKVACFGPGKCFGELALMYDAARAATVRATTASAVWTVKRRAFRAAVQQLSKQKASQNMDFLKQVKSFESLLRNELTLIDQALEERHYKKGTVVIQQGDEGDRFYIVKRGVAVFEKKGADGKMEATGDLGVGTYFGELALLKNCPRAASIIAKEKLTCLELSRADFCLLLGNLDEIMKERAQGYDSPRLNRTGSTSSVHQVEQVSTALEDLKHLGVLGKGAFGFVTLVLDPQTNQSYALKAIKKKQVIDLGQQSHIINEKKVMQMMSNYFLVNLRATYKDPRRVYFLLDACLGGELFTILRRRRYFDVATSRFYAACVIEGFSYMHARNIVYRDLKPENLVLDSNGYLKITDFGFAKVVPERTFTLCGTPDYLAPEIVTGQGHGKGVDWWTLGILIYEMLASFPPFFDDEPIETYRKIIKGRIKFPRYFSGESKDLIKNLLRSKATRRLGVISGGAENIRRHSWYKGFDWDVFRAGNIEPPYLPRVKDPSDCSNFTKVEDDDGDDDIIPADQDFDDDF